MKKKLTFIDYLLIAFLIIVIVAIIFYVSSKKKEQPTTITGNKTVTFLVEAKKVLPDVAEAIAQGDTLVAMNRYQKGHVKHIDIEPDYEVIAKDGQLIKSPLKEQRRLKVTIEAEVNQFGPYLEIGGQEVKAGVNYWLKTDRMHAYGTILSVDTEASKSE